MNNCKLCNKLTKNPKFCSSSCSASYNNTTRFRLVKVKKCTTCATILQGRRMKCDTCLEPKDITLQDIIYSKCHRSSAFALVRTRARKVTRNRQQVCQHCGYTKHVETCHLKAISEFSLDTLLSVVNHPNNLILLCPNCHWELDHPVELTGVNLSMTLT